LRLVGDRSFNLSLINLYLVGITRLIGIILNVRTMATEVECRRTEF
jgi:hypothetical protein